ncbi:MAG: LapA family protein [Gaiellaceae bacterium]
MEGRRPGPGPDQRDIPWSLVAFGVVAFYLVLFVLLNRDDVDISFVFFSAEISELVLILLCLGIGFAAGYLFDNWRRRRRPSET